jgi:hypothetical protein
MNKKLMSLAVVFVVSGCHAPPEGAVCPAPEDEVADNPQVEMTPELEAAMEKARARTRATRR